MLPRDKSCRRNLPTRQLEERERSVWPHACGRAGCLLLLSSICSHLTRRGHSPTSPLGCLPLTLLRASPATPASLLLSPQLSSDLQPASSLLLTAPGISLLPSQPVPKLCLSLSGSVDISNRNIRKMLNFPSFPSAGSSSVLSSFALAGLSTCVETYTRNFRSCFGPSLSFPLWHFLLSLSVELSRFCWENQWALLWPTISPVWPTLPFTEAQLWLTKLFWGLQPLLLWRSDTAAIPLLQSSRGQGTGPEQGHVMVCRVN